MNSTQSSAHSRKFNKFLPSDLPRYWKKSTLHSADVKQIPHQKSQCGTMAAVRSTLQWHAVRCGDHSPLWTKILNIKIHPTPNWWKSWNWYLFISIDWWWVESECSNTPFLHQCRNSGFSSSGQVTSVMENCSYEIGEGDNVGNFFVGMCRWNGTKGQIRIQCMMGYWSGEQTPSCYQMTFERDPNGFITDDFWTIACPLWAVRKWRRGLQFPRFSQRSCFLDVAFAGTLMWWCTLEDATQQAFLSN